jgi:hypothetical protein
MRFTQEQRQLIKGRIQAYRRYDLKRFGTCKDSINYEQYLELIIEHKALCYWTGREMTITEGLPSDVSLDRLDNSKPHTKDNTVLCQRAVNLGRNSSTVLEFTRWLYLMGILSPALVQELQETNTLHLITSH